MVVLETVILVIPAEGLPVAREIVQTSHCGNPERAVIVFHYAHDRIFAEPVLGGVEYRVPKSRVELH